MAQPRLASRPPRACAACYQQKPQALHVDYRAAIEGRLIDPSAPRGGHVDWVIICEDCLRHGIALLPDEAIDRAAVLEQRIADLEAELADTRAYADKVEDALQARPASMAAKTKTSAKSQPRRPRYQEAA